MRVIKATATDGSSWGTYTNLWAESDVNSRIMLVPLTNGRMLAVRGRVNYVFQSRLYTGSSWDTAVDASTSVSPNSQYMCLVADGDNAHLAFVKATSYDLIYVKYVYGTGWGSEETVESSTVAQMHPSITLKDTDKVRVFYLLSQTEIRYRDRDGGSWQSAATISNSESTMTCVNSAYKAYSSKICVTWKSGASSPFDVRFEGYTLGGAILKEVTDGLSLSDAVLRDKTLTISDSVGLVDAVLKDRIFQILDEFSLADMVFGDKTFTVTDSMGLSEIIEVVTGAIIKYVADAIRLAEQINVDRAFIVSEAVNLFDQVFRHRPCVTIADAMGLSENVYVSKILIISDQMALVEVVEKTVAGQVKTKIFLLIGDLAIQITG
jgi:hypothetical protein